MDAEAVPDAELAEQIRCRITKLGWLGTLTGSAVVFASVGVCLPVLGDSHDIVRLGLINGPLVAAFTFVTGLIVNRAFAARMARATAWLAEGREPTAAEHRGTLALAMIAVKLEAVDWAIGAVLFGLINGFVQSWGFGALGAAAIWLGGETTCALDYLLYERVARPLTARALAARRAEVHAPGVRARLVMAWSLGTGVPLLGVGAVAVIGAVGANVAAGTVAGAALFLSVVATVTGLLATMFSARAIGDPLLELRDGMRRIGRGELDVVLPVDDPGEIGQLQAGFNQMADGLRERARIRDLFGRQVGQDVAHAALEQGVRLGGEEREIGALFVDIVGSTRLALELTPTDLVALLNRFFEVVVDVVAGEGGLVNKFEGDAALCVFGAPIACADPAGSGLRVARRLAERLTTELPDIDFGIGTSAGIAVAGNVGSEHRFEYTVIGDPVNEAARLADLAKERPERVLASDAALRRADPDTAASWSITGATVLRGRSDPTGLARPAAS